MVREAVSRLLLVSVGGVLVGIRLLQRGLDGVAATASVVIQLLLSIINQYLFALLGLGLLLSAPIPLLAIFGLRHSGVFERAHALLLRQIGKQYRLASASTALRWVRSCGIISAIRASSCGPRSGSSPSWCWARWRIGWRCACWAIL